MLRDYPALSAATLAEAAGRGDIAAPAIAEAMLAAVAARDPGVEAWSWQDPAHVRAQAEALQRRREAGLPLGSLHGLPVAVKDIFDTRGVPTENGLAADAGRIPKRDATVIARLIAAGAIIAGKTVTTEAAFYAPGKTRNPHDPARTPGGSSSGSAAAVASGQVPAAIGSQTNGSVIRPASFCGVVGFKPSFGLIPRSGALTLSPSLDHVGVFARSIEDAALVADALTGADGADDSVPPIPPQRLLALARSKPPVAPTLAFVRGPAWDRAEPDTVDAFAELSDLLGDRCDPVELPAVFGQLFTLIRVVMAVEMARNLDRYAATPISDVLAALIEEGRGVKAHDYLAALDWRRAMLAGLEAIFSRYDAIVMPSAPGEAPGIETTGDPAFCSLASFLGLPAISLPLMTGAGGLPIGVQLVGAAGQDGRLLRTATWLVQHLNDATED